MPLQSATRARGRVEQLLAEVEGRAEYLFVRYHIPPQDAEDLLQDALLALVVKSPDIQSPVSWLVNTLQNLCVSYWRRRRRWIYEEIDVALQAECVDDGGPNARDWNCDLRRAISRLPERCRSILQLRYRLGCDTSEMASRLGYREGSVRKAEMRCLSALTREIVDPLRESEP